jgi:predicted nucleic acid-binding protein
VVKIAAVVDSACLIGLERIGRLDLLPALLEPIFAPPAVNREFGSTAAWVRVERPVDVGMVAALRLLVDPGESEAIALAYEKGVRIILDDRKAREVAQRLGVAVTGTVGLLLKAKQEGVIPEVRPLLDALDANQFRIGAALRAEALRLAGESI